MVYYDISAFFENIDLEILMYDLETIEFPEDTRALLINCLRGWAEPRKRGIPQSHSESSILSNVYLDSIDKRLETQGILSLRYADDGYIFCKTERDAILALHTLTRVLREKCLNLQTAKTKISYKDEALKDLRIVRENIDKIAKEIRDEAKEYYDFSYLTPYEISKFIEKIEKDINIIALKKAFMEYCQNLGPKFDKSIFHYILGRLGAFEDKIGINFCLEMIEKRPEETDFILNNYFSKLKKNKSEIITGIIKILDSGTLLYDFQKYLIVKWLYENEDVGKALKKVNDLLCGNEHVFTKEFCIAYIGKFGDETYLDILKNLYSPHLSEIRRASIICSLRRMPKTKRNSFYRTVEGNSQLIDLSIAWAKSH
jgi:hypothetical protein